GAGRDGRPDAPVLRPRRRRSGRAYLRLRHHEPRAPRRVGGRSRLRRDADARRCDGPPARDRRSDEDLLRSAALAGIPPRATARRDRRELIRAACARCTGRSPILHRYHLRHASPILLGACWKTTMNPSTRSRTMALATVLVLAASTTAFRGEQAAAKPQGAA